MDREESATARFLAIDVGGSQIKGFFSDTNLEFSGAGVIHRDTLAMDLAVSISSVIPDEITQVDFIFLGLAAIPQQPEHIELLAAALFQRVVFTELRIITDTQAALLDSTHSADLTIAVGTGVTAIVQTPDHNFTLSGHGYLLGDEGGAFWIGKQAINRGLRAIEGLAPDTSLSNAALKFFGTNFENLADKIHQRPDSVTQIASFAKEVVVEAEKGDEVANFILREAALELYALVNHAIQRAGIESVSLIGGAIPPDGLLHKYLCALLETSNITIHSQSTSPLAGVKSLATTTKPLTGLHCINVREINPETWGRLYLNLTQRKFANLAENLNPSIAKASELIADALISGGIIHTFGTGHSHLLAEELFYRAGGLVAIYPLLDERLMLHKDVLSGSEIERTPGLAQALLQSHSIQSNDVIIVISNSGGNQVIIELAKKAQERGVKVIALTSLKQAQSFLARSDQQEKLHNIADCVIDNLGEVGDALLRVPGLNSKIAPTSTVIGGAILHTVIIGAVTQLLSKNIIPELFSSSNIKGGDKHNRRAIEKYVATIHLYK